MEVSHEIKDPAANGSIRHVYDDKSEVEYKPEGNSWLAPFSKVDDEQYKASQRFSPSETFLLQIFA